MVAECQPGNGAGLRQGDRENAEDALGELFRHRTISLNIELLFLQPALVRYISSTNCARHGSHESLPQVFAIFDGERTGTA